MSKALPVKLLEATPLYEMSKANDGITLSQSIFLSLNPKLSDNGAG
jgi:hypothetical protein